MCVLVQCTTLENVEVDISLNSGAGVRAALWLKQQCQIWPALKPLALLLKAWLKAAGLADVSRGGLGSFALALMVIAHLQEEAKVRLLVHLWPIVGVPSDGGTRDIARTTHAKGLLL